MGGIYMRQTELGRFSDASFLILSSLANGPKHGYAMMEDIREFSGTKLEPGTLYGAITRLEEQGWIEAMPKEEKRRPYRITLEGMIALRKQVETLEKVASVGKQRLSALEGF
jgi:DNA-binding PadR family transcriptional regulator